MPDSSRHMMYRSGTKWERRTDSEPIFIKFTNWWNNKEHAGNNRATIAAHTRMKNSIQFLIVSKWRNGAFRFRMKPQNCHRCCCWLKINSSIDSHSTEMAKEAAAPSHTEMVKNKFRATRSRWRAMTTATTKKHANALRLIKWLNAVNKRWLVGLTHSFSFRMQSQDESPIGMYTVQWPAGRWACYVLF